MGSCICVGVCACGGAIVAGLLYYNYLNCSNRDNKDKEQCGDKDINYSVV